MLKFLAENAATILVLSVVLFLIALAVFSLFRDKKKKKDSCCGNCSMCGTACSYRENKR